MAKIRIVIEIEEKQEVGEITGVSQKLHIFGSEKPDPKSIGDALIKSYRATFMQLEKSLSKHSVNNPKKVH